MKASKYYGFAFVVFAISTLLSKDVFIGLFWLGTLWALRSLYIFNNAPYKKAIDMMWPSPPWPGDLMMAPFAVFLAVCALGFSVQAVYGFSEDALMKVLGPILTVIIFASLFWMALPHKWIGPKSVRKKLRQERQSYVNGWWTKRFWQK